jgi:hypothetical protein
MDAGAKMIQSTPGTFSVSSVGKRITHNKERLTMDINDLFNGLMKSSNQFSGEASSQRLLKKSDRSELMGPPLPQNKSFPKKKRPSVQILHLPSDINKIKLGASAGVGRWYVPSLNRSAQVNR